MSPPSSAAIEGRVVLSEKTKIAGSLVIALLTALIPTVYHVAELKFQDTAHEKRINDLEARQEQFIQTRVMQMQEIRTALSELKASSARTEAQVDLLIKMQSRQKVAY